MQVVRSCTAVLVSLVVLAGAMTTSAAGSGAAAPMSTAADTYSSEAGGPGSASTNEGEQLITAASAAGLSKRWSVNAFGGFTGYPIVNGVIYHAVNVDGAGNHASLVASSAATGATLWSAALTTNAYYFRGATIVGNLALLPFDGWQQLGGVSAVNLQTHTMVWSKNRPASTTKPSNDDGTGGQLVADATRAILYGANNDITAFDTGTGAVSWSRNPTAYFTGAAMKNGVFYTAGQQGGLISYNAANGALNWSAPGAYADPVVSSGRVLTSTGDGVAAYPAAGCGHPTCAAIWTTALGAEPEDTEIGGVDGTTVFASITLAAQRAGQLVRLSAATGTREWSAALPVGPDAPIRIADTVWLIANAQYLEGWSVTATTATPLRKIAEGANPVGEVQGISDAGGTLAVQTWPGTLTGYRVTGT